MLLCTCLVLNPHVSRHAKPKLMPQIDNIVNVSSYNKQLSMSSMTNLYCDHHMNLPSDAITVLIVITIKYL